MNILLQVGVKVFRKNKAGKYLLIKRSSLKYPGVKGVWDIVGGRIDPGTGLIANLRREVKEEVALEIISEPRLVTAQDIIPNPEKHIVRLSYIADTEGEPKLDMSENIEYRWCTVAEMKVESDLDAYVREMVEAGLVD